MSTSFCCTAWNLRDRLAELLALLRVGEREVVAALREPDAHRGDRDAAAVEDLQELREPLAARAEQVALRHARALEAQLARVGGVPTELLHRLRDRRTRGTVRDDDVRDLAVPGDGGDRHARVMSVPAFVMNIFEPSIDPLAARVSRSCASPPRRSRRPPPSARTPRASSRRRGRAATAASAGSGNRDCSPVDTHSSRRSYKDEVRRAEKHQHRLRSDRLRDPRPAIRQFGQTSLFVNDWSGRRDPDSHRGGIACSCRLQPVQQLLESREKLISQMSPSAVMMIATLWRQLDYEHLPSQRIFEWR